MDLISLLILIYAIKSAIEDARSGWRTSKAAYMRSADARFPDAPRSRRAARAIQHDTGYWAAQVLRGFPGARRGFTAGWREGRQAQAEGKPVPRQPGSLRRPAPGNATREGREGTREGGTLPTESSGSATDYGPGPWLLHGRSRSGRKISTLKDRDTETIAVWDIDDLKRRLTLAATDPDLEVRVTPLPPSDGPSSAAGECDTSDAGRHENCDTPGCPCPCHATTTEGNPSMTSAAADPGPARITGSLAADPTMNDYIEAAYGLPPGEAARRAGNTVWSATTEGNPSMAVAADTTYDGVLASMTAAKADAEVKTAEQQQASKQASAMSEQMQALEVDPGTLSAMADHLDAHDAATKAQQRVQETAEAVEAAMKRGHAGLSEAHKDAPVEAARKEFYAG